MNFEPEVIIKSNGKRTEVYLGGIKLDGVTSVKFEHEVGQLASLSLTLIVLQKEIGSGGVTNG